MNRETLKKIDRFLTFGDIKAKEDETDCYFITDKAMQKVIDGFSKELLELHRIITMDRLIEVRKRAGQVEPEVKPDACEGWRKEKPNKPCYFIHRYNRKDNKPSIFEAVIDGGVLVVANIQDDEFVETMDDFADGDFFIIEKY